MSKLLDVLNPGQRLAAETVEGPLLVLAGAGSGKTRTIIHRMAYMVLEKGIPSHKIVAVTFTNKAAQEMQSRAAHIGGPALSGAIIRTYHSFGLYLLRNYAQYFDFPQSFNIWDEDDSRASIQRILKSAFQGQDFQRTHVKYFTQKISAFKDELLAPTDLSPEMLESLEFGELIPEVYHLYEQEKENSQSFDFADLLYQSVQLLKSYPDLLEQLQQRYKYFMVDEYQDTNLAQYTLVQLMTKSHRNLCVVGDDDQAIYGWRGANVSNILNFQNDFPDATIAKLEQNYRSTPTILDVANDVIKNNEDRLEKSMVATREGNQLPKLMTLPDDVQEANAIANMIKALQFEHDWDEIAVLYRTNTQSRLIEEALLNLEIPYKIFGGVSFFGRKEIKDALCYLKFLVNPVDSSSFIRLLQNPSRGVGEKSIEKILSWRQEYPTKSFLELLAAPAEAQLSGKASNALSELYEWLEPASRQAQKKVDLGLFFEDILLKSGLRAVFEEEDRLTGSERMENLAELKNSMLAYTNQDGGSLDEYLQSISLYSSTQEAGGQASKAVNLMTVHNAKGLEFQVVLLAGLDEELFPHFFAIRSDSISEERRLFYVAATRAKDKLYLTRAMRRQKQGLYAPSKPSRFLAEISKDFLSETKKAGEIKNPENYFHRKKKPKIPAANTIQNIMPAAKTHSSGGYRVGEMLIHPNFGRGKVVKLEGAGDALKIHLYFSRDNKTRKFVAKFVRLEKA